MVSISSLPSTYLGAQERGEDLSEVQSIFCPPQLQNENIYIWYWARTRDKASHDPMPIPLGYRGPGNVEVNTVGADKLSWIEKDCHKELRF
ncbi:hypothetical protein TNCV_499851 [Trichonephila clavipes]|nr:hypothetical protein TNCV_499851 [Trichonephila clavipes]